MTFLHGKRRKLWIALIATGLVLAVLFGVCAVYLGDYYHTDMTAVEAFAPNVSMRTGEDGNIVFTPENAEAGFIFYPGGKVEHTAYIPLMKALADRGILCVLVEMPFRLAVFDSNAADGIREQYSQIEKWYIGGHSLGGAMAASYVADHAEAFVGLVLLGAYSTADLTQSGLEVLSLYGSEDRVMNREKYAENKPNLPADFTETVIDGGCHAGFGMYGPQDGDGTPTISNTQQIHITAASIADMVNAK